MTDKRCDYCGLEYTEDFCTCQKGALDELKDRYMNVSPEAFMDWVLQCPSVVQSNMQWLIKQNESLQKVEQSIEHIKILDPQPGQAIILKRGGPTDYNTEFYFENNFISEISSLYPKCPIVVLSHDMSSASAVSIDGIIKMLQDRNSLEYEQ